MEQSDGAAGQHHGHHGHNDHGHTDHGQHPHTPAVTGPKPKTCGALRIPLLLAAGTVRLPDAKGVRAALLFGSRLIRPI